jgi:serine/threonine protein kinase
MGCYNSTPVRKAYSISFDDDPLHLTPSSDQHPPPPSSSSASSKKLEIVIDSPRYSNLISSTHSTPSLPFQSSPLNGFHDHDDPSASLRSPCPENSDQQILLNKDDYEILALIQEGAIGKVYHARHRQTHQDYAMKFFGYTSVDPEERDIDHEIHVLYSFRGIQGIIQLIGYFYDTSEGLISGKIYCYPYPVIVMELLTGGELFQYIHQQNQITGTVFPLCQLLSLSPSLSEYLLSRIFYQIIVSVQSIHSKKYIHRDIKLENMMFSAPSATILPGGTSTTVGTTMPDVPSVSTSRFTDGVIKIIDFGLMVKVTGSDGVCHEEDLVGTPGYLAPECLDYYDYSTASDVWSLGCCLYSMLSGLLPFNPPSDQAYLHHRYRPMTGPAWINISTEAKDLLKNLLQRNAHARFSLEQILVHPWLIDAAPSLDLGGEYLSRMKYLALKQKLKSFFLNSHQLMDTNRQTRDQLKKILPLLRKESSSLLSRSSSNSSVQMMTTTTMTMTSSPLSKKHYGYLYQNQLSTSTLGTPQRKYVKTTTSTGSGVNTTPPTLRSIQLHKSTPPGLGGGTSPYMKEQFSTLSKPPIPPHLHLPTNTSSPAAIAVTAALHAPSPSTPSTSSPRSLSPAHSYKSSVSLDYLGRPSLPSGPSESNNSPIKPIRYMSENELQTRLQSFKRSVLSSILKSSSTHEPSSHDLTRGGDGVGAGGEGGGSVDVGVGRGRAHQYTINKETFLCLMIDAGLPELASSRIFHIFDTNDNGVLDIKEFLLTMLAFQSHSGGGGGGGGGKRRKSSEQSDAPRRLSGKFYRTKEQQLEARQKRGRAQLRRSTLDNIEEARGDFELTPSLLLPPLVPSTPSLPLPLPPPPPGSGSGGPTSLTLSMSLTPRPTFDSPCDGDEDSFADSLTNSSPEKRFYDKDSGVDPSGGGGGISSGGETSRGGEGGGDEREEEHLARLYFDIFDLDGNGSIDKEELFVAINAFFLDEITEVNPLLGTTPTAEMSSISMTNAAAGGGMETERGGGRGGGTGRGGGEGDDLHLSTSTRSTCFSFNDTMMTPRASLNYSSSAPSLLSPTSASLPPPPPSSSAYEEIEELFESIDSDHTGKISFEQFKIFFKKIRRSSSDNLEE